MLSKSLRLWWYLWSTAIFNEPFTFGFGPVYNCSFLQVRLVFYLFGCMLRHTVVLKNEKKLLYLQFICKHQKVLVKTAWYLELLMISFTKLQFVVKKGNPKAWCCDPYVSQWVSCLCTKRPLWKCGCTSDLCEKKRSNSPFINDCVYCAIL